MEKKTKLECDCNNITKQFFPPYRDTEGSLQTSQSTKGQHRLEDYCLKDKNNT